jgi:Ca-activated chloride channel family protein
MQPHGGSTALLDAVNLAMGQMREAHNSRKAILVITDAGTVNSNTYPTVQLLQERKVMAEFVHNDVPVYSLNIVDGNKPPARFLADLTGQTGGTQFAVGGGAAALAEVADRISVGLRNLYELEYTPKNTAHDGAYRKVQIELITPPGLPPLQLDYRPGYYESRR